MGSSDFWGWACVKTLRHEARRDDEAETARRRGREQKNPRRRAWYSWSVVAISKSFRRRSDRVNGVLNVEIRSLLPSYLIPSTILKLDRSKNVFRILQTWIALSYSNSTDDYNSGIIHCNNYHFLTIDFVYQIYFLNSFFNSSSIFPIDKIRFVTV